MGFKNAYLLGFDYNFLAYRKKSLLKHFYKKKDVSQTPADEKEQYGRVAYHTYLLFNHRKSNYLYYVTLVVNSK